LLPVWLCTDETQVTYEDLNPMGKQFISPGGPNDPLAVFDGSVIPSGIDGKPTLIYSGVKHLPITWSIEYIAESETQSVAVTYDGGRLFTKLDWDPVIKQPADIEPTAFRDPYFFQSYQLDGLISGSRNGTWYVAVSGGIKGDDAGPAEFLYRQNGTAEDDFQSWEYLGMWWKEAQNATSSDNTFGIVYGFNEEVANIHNIDRNGVNNVDGQMFQ
jgi:beta-fructofuranosidase